MSLMATPLPHVSFAVGMLNPEWLLSSFGALGVLVCVFAETGLPVVGFFLPGDTLLVPAGLLCASTVHQGPRLSLPLVLVSAALGTISGAQVGFLTGRRAGRAAFARIRNRRLRAGAERAEELLARYGYAKAVVLGRFIPVVRTVVNPVAGALGVPVRSFTIWQVAAGLAWSQSLVLVGYWLGGSVRHPDAYLVPAVAAVTAVSLCPLAAKVLRERRADRVRRTSTPAPLPDQARGATYRCPDRSEGEVGDPPAVPTWPDDGPGGERTGSASGVGAGGGQGGEQGLEDSTPQ